MLPPPILYGPSKHYVFDLSVRMCVRARRRQSPTDLPSVSSYFGIRAVQRSTDNWQLTTDFIDHTCSLEGLSCWIINTQLDGKYCLESTDPRESEIRAPCQLTIPLKLSYYLFIIAKLFKVKDGCLKFVYNIKIPGLRRWLDRNLRTRLAIVTENEFRLAFLPRNLPKKFRPDPSTFYLVIVVTNKQTNEQTNQRRWFHNPSLSHDTNKKKWLKSRDKIVHKVNYTLIIIDATIMVSLITRIVYKYS